VAAAQEQAPSTGEAWQSLVFDVSRERDLLPREAFVSIYTAFLGRQNGPRAGWLLASLEGEFVRRRLAEASGLGPAE